MISICKIIPWNMIIGFVSKYKSIKNWVKKLKWKIFFLKVWVRNVGVHYTRQNTVVPCALPLLEAKGIFSSVPCGDPVELRRGKTQVWGALYWAPLGCLAFRVHTEPPAICQVKARFSCFDPEVSPCRFCSGQWWLSVHLSVCSLGAAASLLCWMLEKLIFHLVQLFTC